MTPTTALITAAVAATSPPIVLGLAAFWSVQLWLYGLDQMGTKAIETFGPHLRAPFLPEPTQADEASGGDCR